MSIEGLTGSNFVPIFWQAKQQPYDGAISGAKQVIDEPSERVLELDSQLHGYQYLQHIHALFSQEHKKEIPEPLLRQLKPFDQKGVFYLVQFC